MLDNFSLEKNSFIYYGDGENLIANSSLINNNSRSRRAEQAM